MCWPFILAGLLWSLWSKRRSTTRTRTALDSACSHSASLSPAGSSAVNAGDSSSPTVLKAMSPLDAGDLVTYKARPSYGTGVVEWVTPDGWLVVAFEVDGVPYRDDFDASELERAQPKVTRAA